MAYQALGLGSTANDGTGDDLRTGGDKINDNFVELYTALGSGTALSSGITADATAVTLTAPTINGVVGGTQTSATITTVTTGGIVGTGGALEVTPDNNILEIRGDGTASGTVGQIKLNCSNNNHGQTIASQPHSANVTNTMVLPAGASSTLVSLVSADTLTNKTLTSPTITGTGAIAGASFTASNHVQLAVHATTTARDSAISSPAAGMMIYLTATNKAQVYNGTAWTDLH